MKRWIKNSLIIGMCLIPIGLVAGFSNNWSNKIPISCVGSSGVKPFVESLSKEYMKTNKKIDITVEAGGSGFGIQQVVEGYANIGNVSKDPYTTVQLPDADGGFRTQWENNDIKTVTIGWEAICMVYIPPEGLGINYDGEINLNNLLVVNENNIINFMKIFTGISDPTTNNLSLYDFVNKSLTLSSNQITLLKDTPITPYVRAGGSLTSGTAASFVNCSDLGFDKKVDLNSEEQAAFDSGVYGRQHNLVETDEANSRAWNVFHSANNAGQIVYLSSGFVQQNLDLIRKNGYGIMAYGSVPTEFNVEKINAGYNWFRPLNMLISVKNQETPEISFIKSLISGKYDDELQKNGAKSLSSKEKQFMFPNDEAYDKWISDVTLAKINPNWTWDSPYHFSPTPDSWLPAQ